QGLDHVLEGGMLRSRLRDADRLSEHGSVPSRQRRLLHGYPERVQQLAGPAAADPADRRPRRQGPVQLDPPPGRVIPASYWIGQSLTEAHIPEVASRT